MQSAEGSLGRVFALRLEDGDRLPDSLEAFALEKGIQRAIAFYLGGAADGSRMVVGPDAAHPDRIVPLIHELSGSQEVLAVGTVFPDESGKPVLHMHAAVGREGRASVGCVRAGVDVWLVGEVVMIEIVGLEALRMKDAKSGLQLLRVLLPS